MNIVEPKKLLQIKSTLGNLRNVLNCTIILIPTRQLTPNYQIESTIYSQLPAARKRKAIWCEVKSSWV